MRRRTVLAAVPTVALAGCAGVGGGPDSAESETLIREAINDERQEVGVGPLTASDTLAEAAREHSRDMHEREFYAHKNPDGQQPWDRAACNAAENIHRGEIGPMENRGGSQTWYTDDAEGLAGYVAEGWRLSPEHYRLMVDNGYQSVGVGVFVDDGEFFATAMFC